MSLEEYFDQLLREVVRLFNGRTSFNQPSPVSPPPVQSNLVNTPASYQAPIHGTWANSGGFTYRASASHPSGHMGIDMRCRAGTPVYSLAPGIVSNVGTDPKGGNVVNVVHANGIKTYYAHLSTVNVQKGDKVDTNTVLATSGNTGNASHTFPHVHFRVWVNGQITDPARFFSIPPYTNLSAEEKAQGPWLSQQAKQDAQAFNMQEHLAQRRVAFRREVNMLIKLADQFQQLNKL